MTITAKKVMSPKGDITLYTITNTSGASITLTSVGAGIVSVVVPDSNGNMADVALGYANAADYLYDGPCSGKVPGRYANRIAKGCYTLDGVEYHLPINNGPNCNHGGNEGYHNQIWDSAIEQNKVIFTRISPDGEGGHPGNLSVRVEYSWSEDNCLSINIVANTDKATVLNLTNHTYWNLAGENSESVLDHEMWLACSNYLPTDSTLVPDGILAPVAGTPMDFTIPKPIGRDIKADFPALIYGKGYDNCWPVDGWIKGKLQTVARLTDYKSGRVLEVATTQPAVQVYTGNWFTGSSPVNKSGRRYEDYDGVAIECQHFPDSPNHSSFPSTELRLNEKYNELIIFKFKTL